MALTIAVNSSKSGQSQVLKVAAALAYYGGYNSNALHEVALDK